MYLVLERLLVPFFVLQQPSNDFGGHRGNQQRVQRFPRYLRRYGFGCNPRIGILCRFPKTIDDQYD